MIIQFSANNKPGYKNGQVLVFKIVDYYISQTYSTCLHSYCKEILTTIVDIAQKFEPVNLFSFKSQICVAINLIKKPLQY